MLLVADSMEEESTAMIVTKESKERSWVRGVFLCAAATAGALVITLIFVGTAAGLARRYPENETFSSAAVVYRGSCTLVNRWNTALHLIINILSTAILASSNYSMQTLVAPTRKELDSSHARHKWLDIGSASFRNLSVIPKSRLAIWLVLIITATPFHMIFNSIVFESMAANSYDVALGPTDLNPHNIRNLSTPNLEECFGRYPGYYYTAKYRWNDFVSDVEQGNYETLDNEECTAFTNQNTQSGVKLMMMFTNDTSVDDGGNKSILYALESAGNPGSTNQFIKLGHLNAVPSESVVATPYFWITISGDDVKLVFAQDNFTTSTCMNSIDLPQTDAKSTCAQADDLLSWFKEEEPSRKQLNEYLKANITSRIAVQTYGTSCDSYSSEYSYVSVTSGCIVIKTDEICELIYSPSISVVISLTVFVKVIAITLAARIGRSRSAPILNVGDAICSFMTRPDCTTERMCWASSKDFSRKAWKLRHVAFTPSAAPENDPRCEANSWKNLQSPKRWIKAPRTWRWVVTLAIYVIVVALGSFSLRQAVISEEGVLQGQQQPTKLSYAFRKLLDRGFDSAKYILVSVSEGGTGNWPMLAYSVVANIPQLALTFIYYCYNHILTTMLATAESSSYGVNRKSLRVSSPAKGSNQRSTYYLSLPYRYSVPLMVASTLLHWLVSQSLFYVLVIPFADQQPVDDMMVSALGFLGLPILLSLIIGSIMMLALIGLSFRKYKSAMPIMGSCSAAISAACHPPKDEDLDHAALGLLMWGETLAMPDWAGEDFVGEAAEEKGHCSFTCLDTVPPTPSKLYA